MGKYVIGLGEALFDRFKKEDGSYDAKLGGAPANFAYYARQFGQDAMAVSAIGNDDLGERLLTELASFDLPCLMEKVAYPTGVVDVTVVNGSPNYEIVRDVAWDNIPYSDSLAAIAAGCRAVCFGSLAQRSAVSRATINRFLDAVPRGCLKVFDINLRQQFFTKEILEESFRRSDILKINDEEMVLVSHMFSVPGLDNESRCEFLMRKFRLKMIILTLGANGSYIYHKDGISYLKAPDVKVADTVGAGDSFTGAFIGSLLNGKSVPAAHETAVAVSTFVCTKRGAMHPVPKKLKK